MARITIQDVKASMGITHTYDIINAIRNENPNMQQYVPLANAENVAAVSSGLLINQTLQNDFINSLVDRIGLVVVKGVLLKNPLKRFKKGQLPMGRVIQEIWTDLTKEHMFDQEVAEKEVFKREIPDVKTLFHELNRQGHYKQTISQDALSLAFNSWGAFEDFLSSIIRTMHNSAEVDEYKYMKLAMDNYYANGHYNVVPVVNPVDGQSMELFATQLREMASMLTLPMGSRDYNALAVHTRTDMSNLHLFIDAKLNAKMDVTVLAKAFNMDKADFLGSVTVIDGFASSGLKAVLVDESFFMVYDKIQKSTTIFNPEGLYWNHWFHVWQVISTSRFANAVAFVEQSEAREVTSVITDPTLISLKAGRSLQYTAYVRQTDEVKRDVVWSVEAVRGEELAAGTTITQEGILTVGVNETNQLVVKATVTVDTGKLNEDDEPITYDVAGESVVNVVPTLN